MKFRKKPVIIEAEQFLGSEVNGICTNPKCFINLESNSFHVHTIHNNHPVQVISGDWIIPEPNGTNFYPCKPDIFEMTYEIVIPSNVVQAQKYIADCHSDMGFMGSPEYDRQKQIVKEFYEPIERHREEENELVNYQKLKAKFEVLEEVK